MTEPIHIRSVEDFIARVRVDSLEWPHVWFRGEPGGVNTPLLPRLYRAREDGTQHNENKLLQAFRMRAPIFAAGSCPERSAVDQWLFLAQHVGLPTRLLDWSESALVGLYFALLEIKPIVWMLDPMELNRLSVADPSMVKDEFPLSWFKGSDDRPNQGSINIRGAWQHDSLGADFPIAIRPTIIHPRMSVQRSCFTVHGKNKSSLTDQVPQLLTRFEIEPTERVAMQKHLYLLGISHSTVWPDLDGLAKELTERC